MGIYENIINSKKDNTNTSFNRIITNNSSNSRAYTSSSQTYTNIINSKASNSNDKIISDYANALNKKEQEKQNYVSNSVNNKFKSSTNDSLFAKIQAEKEFERNYHDDQYAKAKQQYIQKYHPNLKASDYANIDWSKLGSAFYNQVAEPLVKTTLNIPVKVAEGALKGGEGILDTLTYLGGNAINWGANKLGITSDQDYEIYKDAISNMVKDDLTDKAMQKFGWNEELTNNFEEGSAVKKDNLFGQVAQGVGQMFPTLLAGNYTGNIGATATSGTSSFGSSLEEAYKEGASDKDAAMYAIGKTAVEIGSEWITGGIPGLKGKGGLDYLADKGIDKISNELIKELTRYGYSMVGEGAEEALAEILTPILKNATYSEGEQINWSDVINSTIVGGLTGGILEAPMNISNISSTVQNMKNKQNIQNTSTNVVQESVYDRIVNSTTQNDSSNAIGDIQSQQESLNSTNSQNNSVEAENNIVYNQGKGDVFNGGQRIHGRGETGIDLEGNTMGTLGQKKGNGKEQRNYSREEYTNFERTAQQYKIAKVGTESGKIAEEIKNNFGKEVVFFDDTKTLYKGGASLDNTNTIYISANKDLETQKFIAGHETLESNIAHNIQEKKSYIDIAIEEILNDTGFIQTKKNFSLDQNLGNVSDRLIAKDIICDLYAQEQSGVPIDYEISLSPETLEVIKYNTDMFNEKIKNKLKTNSLLKQPTIEERLSNDARVFNLENNSQTINNKKKNKPVRKYSESVQKSDVLDQKIVQEVLDSTDFTYVAQSNKKQVAVANKQIENFGYDGALKQFNNFYDSNKRVTANDLALGQRLLQEASKKGDVATVSDLLPKVAALGTELGQAVQVLGIINRLTPEGQLRVLHRTIDRLKGRNVKGADKLNLTEEQINKILNSKDKTELNKNVTEVVEQLADKLPSTLSEKLNSWRYLSMLGNPKTHIRNLVSNSAMLGTSSVKNIIAKTLEGTVDTLNRKLGKNHFIFKNENRTKTWKKTTIEVKNFVKEYQTELNNTIDRSSKYSIEGEIQKAKKIFGKKGIGKFVQTLSDFNSNALTFEDTLFKNIAFSRAMEQYLTANGMETKADIDNNPKLVENAKIYAIEESLKATFQQYSALASYLNRIDNKAGRLALDSIIPFTKTPINVAKTGIAYSPLGLVKSLTTDSIKLKKGDITVSQYIDNISQGLTGSGIVALGMMLAQMGIIQGAGEDDKEGQYDEALGQQSYSINIGGSSFTLDWLSPVAMPLFVGAEIEKAREKGIEDAFNVNSVTKMFTSTLDPIMSMSFLQGINNALNSYSYNGMQSVIEESVKSYIGQYFPTLGGQLAKTIDPTIRSTSVSKDSGFTLLEQIIRTNAAKIPGVSYLLEPATDVWGNEKKRSDSVLERAFENFIAPYSKKEDITTEIDKELKSIYSSTGEDKVLPNTIINKYITYKGEKYETNAESYTQYKKTYGQTAYDTLKELFETDTYKNADDNGKADMIDKVYDYASDKAKQEFLKIKGVTYTNSSKDNIDVYKENSIVEAIKDDVSYEAIAYKNKNPEKYNTITGLNVTYDNYSKYQNEVSALKKKYEGAKNSKIRKQKVSEYINSLPLKKQQKIMLFKELGGYSISAYKNEMYQYINSLKISKLEKEEIWKRLYG